MDHWSSPNGCHPDCPACAEDAESGKLREFVANMRDGDPDLVVDEDAEINRTEGGGAWVSCWFYLSPDDVKEALSAKD